MKKEYYKTRKEAEKNRTEGARIWFVAEKGYYVIPKKKRDRQTHTVGEIWDIMPKRIQGVVMMGLFLLLINASLKLLDLIPTNIWWVDLGLSIIQIIGVFKCVMIIAPWLSK